MPLPDDASTTQSSSASDGDADLVRGSVPSALMDMPTRRLVAANAAFAQLLRLDVSQVKGLDYFSLVPPEHRHLLAAMLSGMASGHLHSFEGPARWHLPDGGSVDVARWWRSVDDLRPSKALLAAVPASGPGLPIVPLGPPAGSQVALGTVDHEWRFADIGPDAAHWLGWRAEEFRGTALQAVVHPDDAPLLLLALNRSGLDGRGVLRGLRVRSQDGEWVRARCALTPLCQHNPPRLAVAMWSLDAAPPEDPSERAGALEDHLWRIALEVAAAGISHAPATTESWWSDPILRGLSQRRLEILRRLLRGERVPTIAKDLFLSQSTVRNHLSAIYRRLGVHSQAELVARLLPGTSGAEG